MRPPGVPQSDAVSRKTFSTSKGAARGTAAPDLNVKTRGGGSALEVKCGAWSLLVRTGTGEAIFAL